MKLDSPAAIEQAKRGILAARDPHRDRIHGAPYKPPKQRETEPEWCKLERQHRFTKSLSKLRRITKAEKKPKQTKVTKQVIVTLLTKLK